MCMNERHVADNSMAKCMRWIHKWRKVEAECRLARLGVGS